MAKGAPRPGECLVMTVPQSERSLGSARRKLAPRLLCWLVVCVAAAWGSHR